MRYPKYFTFPNFNISNEATYWEPAPSSVTLFCPDPCRDSKHMLHIASEANLKPSVSHSLVEKNCDSSHAYRLKFKPCVFHFHFSNSITRNTLHVHTFLELIPQLWTSSCPPLVEILLFLLQSGEAQWNKPILEIQIRTH